MIEFSCWGCGKSLKAKPESGGKKCKCSGCGRLNQIPDTPPIQDAPKAMPPTAIQPKAVPWYTPVLVVFAAIGMATVVLLALYLIFGGQEQKQNAGPKPVRNAPRTMRDVLDLQDEQLENYLGAMKLADLEEFHILWFQFLEREVRGETNMKRAMSIYNKIGAMVSIKKRGMPKD